MNLNNLNTGQKLIKQVLSQHGMRKTAPPKPLRAPSNKQPNKK